MRIRDWRCWSRPAAGAYLALETFGALAEGAPRANARPATTPTVLALLVAVGIGLHNFGEGLAIGAAFALGEAALGTLLILGFTLHNTTEGLAIVAPMAKSRPSLRTLIGPGPDRRRARRSSARGAAASSTRPVLAVACLGLGAGAIAQVIGQIVRQITPRPRRPDASRPRTCCSGWPPASA